MRSFAQDDAHVFCEKDQVEGEIERFFQMLEEVYTALGLDGIEVAVSTRPEEFLGEPEDWDRAEATLQAAVERAGFECGIKEGEAVFYAPKVEVDFHDVLGRRWTLGTIQIDMALPGRFGLRYIGRDGNEHQPEVLHRAVLGSIERFMALYIEHTGGDFPLWLAPVQVLLLPIADRHEEAARKVAAALEERGVRVEVDARSEKLNFKIREAELQKVPIMAVVGDQEQADGTVTPRRRHAASRAPEPMAVDTFVTNVVEEIDQRRSAGEGG